MFEIGYRNSNLNSNTHVCLLCTNLKLRKQCMILSITTVIQCLPLANEYRAIDSPASYLVP